MAVNFTANSIQSYDNFIEENWKDGFIVDWGEDLYNNTLKCKIIGPPNTSGVYNVVPQGSNDYSPATPSGYRFLYKAEGNNDADTIIKWALVFVFYGQSDFSPVRCRTCNQTHLRVSGKSLSNTSNPYYGLNPTGKSYVQTPPAQVNTGAGTIYGNDIISEMYTPQNGVPYCQITCCGEIPYTEVEDNTLKIQFKKVSAGMISSPRYQVYITCSAWYWRNYGNGLSYNVNQMDSFYANATVPNQSDIFYGNDNANLKPTDGEIVVPTIVSYHESSVSGGCIGGVCCWQCNGQKQPWSGVNVYSQINGVADEYISNNKLTFFASYWNTNNNENIIRKKYVDVVYAPNYVNITTSLDGDTLTIRTKAYPAQGNSGYFSAIKLSDGTNTAYIADSIDFRNSDRTITLTKNPSTGIWSYGGVSTGVGSNLSYDLTITCCCKKGDGNYVDGKYIIQPIGSTTPIVQSATLSYPNAGNSRIVVPQGYLPYLCFDIVTAGSAESGNTLCIEQGGQVVWQQDLGEISESQNNFKLKLSAAINYTDPIIFYIANQANPPRIEIPAISKEEVVDQSTTPINTNNLITIEQFQYLCDCVLGVLENSRTLLGDDYVDPFIDAIEFIKKKDSGELISTSVRKLTEILVELYFRLREEDDWLNVGDYVLEPPLVAFNIQDFSWLGISNHTIENMSVQDNTIIDADVDSNSIIIQTTDPTNNGQNLIIADGYDDLDPDATTLPIYNNYQKAILYIINKLFFTTA